MALLMLLLALFAIQRLVAVQIIKEPQDQTVNEGGNAVFACDYNGTLSFPFWRINGTSYSRLRLPSRHAYFERQLTVSNVQLSDNFSTYSCAFSTISSRVATLIVIPLPKAVTSNPTPNNLTTIPVSTTTLAITGAATTLDITTADMSTFNLPATAKYYKELYYTTTGSPVSLKQSTIIVIGTGATIIICILSSIVITVVIILKKLYIPHLDKSKDKSPEEENLPITLNPAFVTTVFITNNLGDNSTCCIQDYAKNEQKEASYENSEHIIESESPIYSEIPTNSLDEVILATLKNSHNEGIECSENEAYLTHNSDNHTYAVIPPLNEDTASQATTSIDEQIIHCAKNEAYQQCNSMEGSLTNNTASIDRSVQIMLENVAEEMHIVENEAYAHTSRTSQKEESNPSVITVPGQISTSQLMPEQEAEIINSLSETKLAPIHDDQASYRGDRTSVVINE